MLEVRDLRVTFGPRRRPFVAVDGVSLTVGANETVGLVGSPGRARPRSRGRSSVWSGRRPAR